MRQNLRRLPLFLALLTMMVSLIAVPSSYASGYSVAVNGRTVSGVQAEIVSGQMMVAVRPYIEAMGGTVAWEAAAQRISINQRTNQVAMWIGSAMAFKNGVRQYPPVKPYANNGHTMVPAWWLASILGGKASFINSTLAVTIAGAPVQTAPSTDPLKNASLVFPFPVGATYEPYRDTMGESRSYGGERRHEGTDIMADTGTPVVAVGSGKVVRYGWSELGGYRLTIQLTGSPYKIYYAHLDRYASGMYEGKSVQAGQLIGYTGSTGYGPEGTKGKFVSHLHVGIYDGDWNAVNPYSYLKYWETNKVNL